MAEVFHPAEQSKRIAFTLAEVFYPVRQSRKIAFTLTEVFHPAGRSKRIAFTLAEVLITLGIIGVVAALTMPSLIVKYEKQRTVTQLKKAYTEIAQALKLAEVEHDSHAYLDYTDGETFANTYLVPYMKIVKNCGKNSGCLKSKETYNLLGNKHNYNYADSSPKTSKFIVSSGSVLGVTSGGDYVNIQIVINNKDKIVMGKDIFFTDLDPSKEFGEDLQNSDEYKQGNYACSKDAPVGAGLYCLELIIVDGWKIKDDYPW